MGRTYKCDGCEGVFEAQWSEEEAIAEKEKNFGDYPMELCAQVCDDCYKEIMCEISN